MPDDRSDDETTPSSEDDSVASSDADGTESSAGSFTAPTTGQVPTADLRTADDSSERLDAAFALLSDSVRREALYRLADSDGAALSVESLAEAVRSERSDASTSGRSEASASGRSETNASGRSDAGASGRTSEGAADAGSLAVELRHAHLPKLESHGVVRYDPTEKSVEYRGHEWLDEWLEHARRAESR